MTDLPNFLRCTATAQAISLRGEIPPMSRCLKFRFRPHRWHRVQQSWSFTQLGSFGSAQAAIEEET